MPEFVSFFKASLTPRSHAKATQARTAATARREAYRAIERRDRMRCRACGRPVVKGGGLRLDALQHHHLHHGRRVESTAAICCLCREDHDARHVTRTLHIDGDADGVLHFEQDGRVWTSAAMRSA